MSKLTCKVGYVNPRYVSFADFLRQGRVDVLAKQLAERLEIEANSQSEAIDFVKQVLIDIAADDMGMKNIDELEARCAALAAENAGLKESRKNLAEFIHEELDADYPLNMDIETPATDAFLAEVRAHGVEMFAGDEKKLSESHMQDGNLDTAIQIASSSRRASDFAAQLRKGVQS